MYSATFNYEVARSAVAAALRTVPDFPKSGIMFRDITPVLANPALLHLAIMCHLEKVADLALMCHLEKVADLTHPRSMITKVVGIESRGFLFGMAVAYVLGAGFVPVRKPGKLPAATVSQSYGLEYEVDELHLHADAVGPGDRVIVVDDLLATGGTAHAAATLVRRLGGEVVSHLFLIELAELGGRAKLQGRVDSVLTF